jgi:uncharacterized protein with PQ loop repeat
MMNMKIFAGFLALVFYFPVHSQTTEGKNMGKINLSAFVAKGFSIQYERQVGKRLTVALFLLNYE